MPSFVTLGKSKQFYNFLRTALLNDEYQVGEKFPSITELSVKYEISRPTVNSVISNLVNEGFLRVEQGKGTFVMRTSNELPTAQKLIGVIMEEYSHDINIENVILGSISDILLKEGYYTVPINTYSDKNRFYNGLSSFMRLEVGGMIILPPASEDYDDRTVSGIINDLPVVCINRDLQRCNRDVVRVDFEQGGRIAAEYLIRQGRRRIMLPVCHGRTLYSMLAKGYRAAHEALGVPPDPSLTDIPETDIADRLAHADGLIATDLEIYRNRQVFKRLGIRLPKDMGIVGINDSSYSRIFNPPLSSIRFSGETIGRQSANLLLKRMMNPQAGPQFVNIPMDLIRRNT